MNWELLAGVNFVCMIRTSPKLEEKKGSVKPVDMEMETRACRLKCDLHENSSFALGIGIGIVQPSLNPDADRNIRWLRIKPSRITL